MTVIHLDNTLSYMHNPLNHQGGEHTEPKAAKQHNMSIGKVIGANSNSSDSTMGKKPGKRPGRKPSKIDERAKLERSRQSARECRARKKLRYQYLEELVMNREKAVFAIRDELETYNQWCSLLDKGGPIPENLRKALANDEVAERNRLVRQRQQFQQQAAPTSSSSSASNSAHANLLEARKKSFQGSQLPPNTPSLQNHPHHVPAASLPNQFQGSTTIRSPSHLLVQPSPMMVQMRQPQTGPPLLRQEAIDVSHYLDLQNFPITSSSGQDMNQLCPVSSSSVTQQQIFSQKKLSQHPALVPRVHSEPPFNYSDTQPAKKINTNLQLAGFDGATSERFRARSSSNPQTLLSSPRASWSRLGRISEQTNAPSSVHPPDQSLGLFSGSLVQQSIPTTVTVDDGSSSDENIDSSHLFQSSLQNKRSTHQLLFNDNPKRTVNTSQLQSFDSTDIVHNLTSYSYNSASSSPMSYGMSPIRTASPASVRYLTPTSSTTSSPAPSSTMSSILEYAASPLNFVTNDTSTTIFPSISLSLPLVPSTTSSPAPPPVTSSIMSPFLDTPAQPTHYFSDSYSPAQSASLSSGFSTPGDALPAGLSASISEPISMFSYLDYLSSDNLPSLSSLIQEDQSNQNVIRSSAVNTSEVTFNNVPNIIKEFFEDNL